MSTITSKGRIVFIIISLIFVITGITRAYDPQEAWDNTYWIRENYPEIVYVQNAVIFGASPWMTDSRYGASHQVVGRLSTTDIKMIYFGQAPKEESSYPISHIIDSLRFIDGSIAAYDKQQREIIFDSALTAYIGELGMSGPVSLEVRIPDAEVMEIYDFSGSPVLCEYEHYTLYFTPNEYLTVDSVKRALENILPPDCYAMEKGIPICFDTEPPADSCIADFYDDLTDEQWYLTPFDSVSGEGGINAFKAWEIACPYLHNDVTVVIHDRGQWNNPKFHPDYRDNVNLEKTRINWAYDNCGSHGVQVAGVAGAAEGNHPASHTTAKSSGNLGKGIGIIGVSPKTEMILLNWEDNTDQIYDLRYAIDSCGPVDVVNFSWGMIYPDAALKDLIMVGHFKKDISFVAAAGNGEFEIVPYYTWPAAFGHFFGDGMVIRDLVIAVSGRIQNCDKWKKTNYGEFVDFSAPSVDILTTGVSSSEKGGPGGDEGYIWEVTEGTSFSAPMVTGAIAVMKSVMKLPKETIYDILTTTAYNEPDDSVAWNEYRGFGTLDMGAAVEAMMNSFCDTIYGDVNGDAFVNCGDARYLIDWLYRGGPEPIVPDSIIDANGDCTINIMDAQYICRYVYYNGPAPIGCHDLKNPNSLSDNKSNPLKLDNYPNPFNPTTQIYFTLPEASEVRLTIFNIVGQKVETLLDTYKEAGSHSVSWDGSKYASGIYFYQLKAGGYSESRRMMVLK